MERIVRVAVEGLPLVADRLYGYRLAEGMNASVGSVVSVPFGGGNRLRRGVVLASESDADGDWKTVHSVGDCYLSPEASALIVYMKEKYFCSYFDAALCLLPPGVFGVSSRSLLSVSLTDPKDAFAYLEAYGDNQKHADVLGLLAEEGQMTMRDLLSLTGVSESVVRTLKKRGLVRIEKSEVPRDPLRAYSAVPSDSVILNGEQQQAADELAVCLNSGQTHLLYGVTGSGKTQVFITLIDRALAQGRQAVLLLPEISLTLQIIERLYSHYAGQLAVLHSGLSAGERLDEWKRIRAGRAEVIVGTRSAVFAPVRPGALFIIDEEQEHTYKSERSPRYHAREIAAWRAAQGKGLLLLASATPSFESRLRADQGRIGYHALLSRYNGKPLPKVITADLRREHFSSSRSCIGRVLAQAMEENLQRKEQTILFMNRRGYRSHISCPSCGAVVKCPYCGIPMTYHASNNRVICNYCGSGTSYVSQCPVCGEKRMQYTGVGTQKAEAELQMLFPGIRVVRMDADTVIGKHSRDQILTQFREHCYDVLLGTQMITKGLDFPDVTLVGVLNADMSLYSSDFRAFEKSFSLLTQVVGRAGRAEKEGRAVVQTYSPNHYVLRYAFEQDYEGFYREATALRKEMLYPPFCDICQICILAPTEEEAFAGAELWMKQIRQMCEGQYSDLPVRLIQPKVTAIPMVEGKTRVRILMKCRDTPRQREMLTELLLWSAREKQLRPLSVTADMNPINIL